MYSGTFGLSGNPGPTQKFTLADSGQSIETLFGNAYKQNSQEPIAFVVSVETNDIRVGFDAAVGAGGIGHPVYEGGSARYTNLGAVQKALLSNYAVATNAVVHITLEY